MVPDRAMSLYARAFGGSPEAVASAPGRVNLIGDHTDYNGGEVLPVAIESRTAVAIGRVRDRSTSAAVSESDAERGEFDLLRPEKSGSWWDYVAGAAAQLPADCNVAAVEIAIASDIPQGAGLGWSAALEVATVRALSEICGSELESREVATAAWRAETTFVGVDRGIMDQYASALCRRGQALHVWCDTNRFEQVRFARSVLIFDTASPASLRASKLSERRRECIEALTHLRRVEPDIPHLAAAQPELIESAGLPDVLHRRASHVANENLRVDSAVRSLKDRGTVSGTLLYESHVSLRDLYECSTPELDWFVDRAMKLEGVDGARLTGQGWGGCAIALGPHEALAGAGEQIAREYTSRFHLTPRFWLTTAADGARVETGR
jgi:galactokinase